MHDHHDHEHDHGHKHTHGHDHGHEHEHEHKHAHDPKPAHDPGQHKHGHGQHTHGLGHHHVHSCAQKGSVLVLRPYTGISGDIMVAGLARMLDADQKLIDETIAAIGLNELTGGLSVQPHALHEVGGWQCRVTLPHEHSHRTLTDIRAIISASTLEDSAKTLAEKAFCILAEAEGAVHGKTAADVAFHEVGALDSILDTCLAAALFAKLAPARFVCGSLPVCDGAIRCAHGTLPAPAPAVMRLLHGVPVHGIATSGETVTPTGLALLKAFDAQFGTWPAMTIEREALVYGTRVFEGVPNGAIFACGNMR